MFKKLLSSSSGANNKIFRTLLEGRNSVLSVKQELQWTSKLKTEPLCTTFSWTP